MEEKIIKKFLQKMKDSKQLTNVLDGLEPEIQKAMFQSLIYKEFSPQEFSEEKIWEKYFDHKKGFLVVCEGSFKVSTEQDNTGLIEKHNITEFKGCLDNKSLNLENRKIVKLQALKLTKTLILPDKYFDSFFGDSPSIIKKYQVLRKNDMFLDCDRVEIVNFAKNCRIKKFKLRQPIFIEGKIHDFKRLQMKLIALFTML